MPRKPIDDLSDIFGTQRRLSTLKAGDMVQLVFKDHAEDSELTVDCELFGRIVHVDASTVVLDSWIARGQDWEHNNKRWAIVRSAVYLCNKLAREEN